MAGGTKHHSLSLTAQGSCRPADSPGSNHEHCKAHRVHGENPPEGCDADRGFVAQTEICGTCSWTHPDHQDFERDLKAQHALAVKEGHEKRIKFENEKQANEAKALKGKKAAAAKKKYKSPG